MAGVRVLAPRRPGGFVAWGRPARFRTGGAGVCRKGRSTPSFWQRLRRPVRCRISAPRWRRAAVRPVWGRVRHRVRWASRAPGAQQVRDFQHPALRHAACSARLGSAAQGAGAAAPTWLVVEVQGAGRLPPPWSRRVPRPVERQCPRRRARYRCRGPPSGGSRLWSKWHLRPGWLCGITCVGCQLPWLARTGGRGGRHEQVESVSPHRTRYRACADPSLTEAGGVFGMFMIKVGRLSQTRPPGPCPKMRHDHHHRWACPALSLRKDAHTIGLHRSGRHLAFFHLLPLPLIWLIGEFGLSYRSWACWCRCSFRGVGGRPWLGFVAGSAGCPPLHLFLALTVLALAGRIGWLAQGHAGLVLASALAGLGNAPFHPVDFTILNKSSQPRAWATAFGAASAATWDGLRLVFPAGIATATGPGAQPRLAAAVLARPACWRCCCGGDAAIDDPPGDGWQLDPSCRCARRTPHGLSAPAFGMAVLFVHLRSTSLERHPELCQPCWQKMCTARHPVWPWS